MAKEDFCFTYYDGDAARDKAHMNRLERGGYDDMITSQRKFGHLSLALIKKTLGSDFDMIWEAIELVLKKDSDGKYYIDWLDDSIQRMKRQAVKQSENGKMGGRPKTQTKPKRKPNHKPNESQEKPLEDGNEYGNEIDFVIENLNQVVGSEFKKSTQKNRKLILARLTEGFKVTDFEVVITDRFRKWGEDAKMKDYLRPETLFGQKFEGYLNAARAAPTLNSVEKMMNANEKVKNLYPDEPANEN